jgi:ribosomal-protein-alanine N-acetyltransferase
VIDPAHLPSPASERSGTGAADPAGALEITSMRRRHLRSVIRIEVQSYPRPWSLGLYLSELALGSLRCYVVARRAGEVVGYGGVMYIGPDAHVTTLAVAPEFHRQGIGGRVLLHLARAAVAHGAENLTLEVRVTNEAAIGLYRRFGFVPAGVRKNYYAEINEDALVMWANDINTPDYAARLDRVASALGMPAGGWPPALTGGADDGDDT